MENPSEGKLTAVEGRKQESCAVTCGGGGPVVVCHWEVKFSSAGRLVETRVISRSVSCEHKRAPLIQVHVFV